jgi:sorbitol-specific phosphotransferase system component IIA
MLTVVHIHDLQNTGVVKKEAKEIFIELGHIKIRFYSVNMVLY